MATRAISTEQQAPRPHSTEKETPYDQFNLPMPDRFPKEGLAARAAKAIMESEC